VLVSGSVDDQVTTSQAVIKQVLKQLNAAVLYPDVRILNEGGAKETQKSMKSLLKAFIMAVFAIFLLLVLLFNSYTQPLLVLSAIPFSAIGVIWAFFLHAQALSFFAMLGGLALIGVIVNDSLVMVSHLNYLKQKLSTTTPVFEWVVRGAKERLRAVVLTTLATLISAVANDDDVLLAKTPGIGKKTAQKLIVELKDRLAKLELINTNNQTVALSSSNPNTGKALSALQALGFKVKEAEKMLRAITDNSLSTEQLITHQ
jgi:multidrug efflux pump subunit AcrB